MHVEILYEDGPCLVVNKPAGILTQGPPAIEDTLVHRVKADLKQRYNKPGNVYLGIPHRLDRAVSGVVLFAKNSKAAHRLAEQFRDRQVQKTYWALVSGQMPQAEGSLCHWLDKHPEQPLARVVESTSPTAREALLRYRVIATDGQTSLVEVLLVTGRFHQIRVQFAEVGCPVLGDRPYGSDRPFAEAPVQDGSGDMPVALHARRLQFLHPVRYDLETVQAPLPAYWQDFFPAGFSQGESNR